MEENILTKEDIENVDLVFKWTVTRVKHRFDENQTYNYYGRLVRVTDDAVLIYSKRKGFLKVFLRDILSISEADNPQEEI